MEKMEKLWIHKDLGFFRLKKLGGRFMMFDLTITFSALKIPMNKRFTLLRSGVQCRVGVLFLALTSLFNLLAASEAEASERKRFTVTDDYRIAPPLRVGESKSGTVTKGYSGHAVPDRFSPADNQGYVFHPASAIRRYGPSQPDRLWSFPPPTILYPASPHASAGWNSLWNLELPDQMIVQTDPEKCDKSPQKGDADQEWNRPVELYVTGVILNGADEWMRKHIDATSLAFDKVNQKLNGNEDSTCEGALRLLLDAIKNGRSAWGDRLQCAATLNNAGNCAYYDGDLDEAVRLYQQALETATEDSLAEDSPITLAIVRNLWHAHMKAGHPVSAQVCANYVGWKEVEIESSRVPFYKGLAWVVTSTAQVEYTADNTADKLVDAEKSLDDRPVQVLNAYLYPSERRQSEGELARPMRLKGW